MGEKQEPLSLLSSSPSFNSYSANRLGEIADRVINELAAEQEGDDSQDGRISAVDNSQAVDRMTDNSETAKNAEATESGYDSDDFEFTFLCRGPDSSPISADEIFSNGQIRPIFPVFNRDLIFNDSASNGGIGAGGGVGGVSEASRPSVRIPLRKLLLEDRDPATSSTGLEDLPAGSYCVWTPRSVPPSPDRCKKSNSTGSSKRWRLKNLLHRSSSDGKETFLFLSPSAAGKEEAARVKKVNSGKEKAGPAPSAHEMHYVRNRASKDADRRRSFLPYRPDIVGFFANVNGLSRNLHPF